MIERTCSFGGFIVTRTGEMVSSLSGKFLCVQRWHDALACGMLYQLQAHVEEWLRPWRYCSSTAVGRNETAGTYVLSIARNSQLRLTGP